MRRWALVAAAVLAVGLVWWSAERVASPRRSHAAGEPAPAASETELRLDVGTAGAPASDRARAELDAPAVAESLPDGAAPARALEPVSTPAPAAVFGFVWDADGEPVSDLAVTLAPAAHPALVVPDRIGPEVEPWPEGTAVLVHSSEPERALRTATDAGGGYAFDEVPPGSRVLRLDPRSEVGASLAPVTIRLAPGERRRVDFGVPVSTPRVRGTLRTRSGAAPWPGARLHVRGRGVDARVDVGADGAFELHFPPGRYALAAELAPGEDFRAPLGEVELGAGDAPLELRLGGTRVSGTVTRLDRGTRLAGTDRYQELWLRAAEDDTLFRRTWVDADGRFAFEAVEPGTWVLDGFPLPVATGAGSLRVDVLPHAVELAVEVAVSAP